MDAVAAQAWLCAKLRMSPWLHEEVARRMQDRLQWVRKQPRAWSHWEPLAGGLQAHELLRARYPGATCHIESFWPPASQARSASALAPLLHQPLPQRLKFAASAPLGRSWGRAPTTLGAPQPGQCDLVWANMLLHAVPNAAELFARWHRSLAVDGFVMFSGLGPDSLRELRALYQSEGLGSIGADFTDMHDWGDMLIGAGFAEPVMDMERITLTFANARALLAELRGLGRNLHVGRFEALRGRGYHAHLLGLMEQRLRSDAHGGQMALTFEVIYGHAIKPRPRPGLAAHTAVSLDDMRAMLRPGA